MELCPNSLDVQNSFTMKYATDQMFFQKSPKRTMIEMIEMTPQKQLPEQILHSTKNAKTNMPSKSPQ